ncbi:MAG: cupin domain-containing protein [Desulfobacter postgatei]|uniref:cupin domain-containing protein n=1 Tax=Desulfobacter postgatei TaxID=2293 RepID=UPI0023F3DC39|nr:cupin domain-containing protein [Desulfobacter postgatei]MDD4275142.1 cupin domain-containing protein [Desulfobacter postgatei]
MKFIDVNQMKCESVSHDIDIKKKVILKNGLIPHLTNFSQSLLKPLQTTTVHKHKDMYEVFYVLSGIGSIVVNGEEFSIQKGSCIAVFPGESHSIMNNGNMDLVLNYFGLV